MSETRRVSISLKTVLKRSWPALAVGGVLMFIVAIVTVYVIITTSPFQRAEARTDGDFSVPTTTAGELVPRKLDGVPVPFEASALQTYAVMVENAPEARPLMGPAKANLVIEAPVEGGITRFLLVFDATSTVDQIGPVRSARPYYVEFANGLGAVFTHVGGSPEALDLIRQLTFFRNVDEFSSGKYFWRSAKRPMPHNVYTRMDLLRSADEAKGWEDGLFRGWRYGTSTESGDVREVNVPFAGVFAVRWTYDPASGRYRRFQSGAEQKDADGTPVEAANIVVMRTEEQVLDEVGRLRIRTTGSGKATVYRNGEKIESLWRRAAGEWLRFETVDGIDVEFTPGTTWIEVVTSMR
ncbi:DUF3048 domain-containing protein [Candidatus Uhrbacteria bacterium]|nr:DUF3048 domain-containing protein [Candidatus Uhrbacteria bacterium]